MQVVLGENLVRLMKPGRVCRFLNPEECGYIVVRRRKRKHYVYLDTGDGEVYLGPLDRYKSIPVTICVRRVENRVVVDLLLPEPESAEEILSSVKGIYDIIVYWDAVKDALKRVLTKYKLIVERGRT